MSRNWSQDVELYIGLLNEVKERMNQAHEHLRQSHHIVHNEFAALQVRKVLEIVALSSLVTNREAFSESARKLDGHRINEARKQIKRHNRDWWPEPLKPDSTPIALGEVRPLRLADEPFLKEEEFGPAYGFTSSLLHSPNPFAGASDVQADSRRLLEILDKLRVLLNHHRVRLVGDEYFFVGVMHTNEGQVHVALFERVKE